LRAERALESYPTTAQDRSHRFTNVSLFSSPSSFSQAETQAQCRAPPSGWRVSPRTFTGHCHIPGVMLRRPAEEEARMEGWYMSLAVAPGRKKSPAVTALAT
jgi:hypothetical protein